MKLVECLVAGIAGAASGTATFVLRGTASTAVGVMYNEFEGTTQPATNVVTLDSNGCAEIYVNALCDMTLKTAAGATLRTVTVGDAATCVEVISDSFTGTDYSGSPTAVSEPITLAAILDKWNNSAGQPDWKVTFGGVATNLSSAFAAFAGFFTNVKDPTYGAVGDGVTDDTTAINNAITAAGGGHVFFPAGTYSVTTLLLGTKNVTLLGTGPNSSIISGSASTTSLIQFTDNTSGGWKRIESIGMTIANNYANILLLEQTQNVYIRNCHFDGTNVSNDIISRPDVDGQVNLYVSDCHFLLGSAASNTAIGNDSDDAETYISVKNCFFEIPAAFQNTVLKGPDFNVSGCEFDGLLNSGSFNFMLPSSIETSGKVLGSVNNCVLRTAGTSSIAFNLGTVVAGSKFNESGNIFYGFDVSAITDSRTRLYNVSATTAGDIQISLKSRESRSVSFSGAFGATETIGFIQDYGNITVVPTDAGALTITPNSTFCMGCITNLTVHNASGGTKTITISPTFGSAVWTNLADGSAATAMLVTIQGNDTGVVGGLNMLFASANAD